MVENTINKILLESSPIQNGLSTTHSLKDNLGIDSLGMVELMVALEEKFDIEFDESDLDPENIKIVSDLYALVHRYVEGKRDEAVWLFKRKDVG